MTIKELIIKLSDYPQDMRVFVYDGIYSREIRPDTKFTICQGNNNEWYKDNSIGIGEEFLEVDIES
jgi:hypothetical protein